MTHTIKIKSQSTFTAGSKKGKKPYPEKSQKDIKPKTSRNNQKTPGIFGIKDYITQALNILISDIQYVYKVKIRRSKIIDSEKYEEFCRLAKGER